MACLLLALLICSRRISRKRFLDLFSPGGYLCSMIFCILPANALSFITKYMTQKRALSVTPSVITVESTTQRRQKFARVRCVCEASCAYHFPQKGMWCLLEGRSGLLTSKTTEIMLNAHRKKV